MPLALTLQPVIGQRRSAKATLHVNRNDNNKHAYHNNHSTADESRELRRFDTLRDDRGHGQGKHHFKDRLTVSGEAAAKQAHKPFKQYKPKNDRSLSEGSPATFQSWYVPEGVSTGPRNHRNAGADNGAHPNKKAQTQTPVTHRDNKHASLHTNTRTMHPTSLRPRHANLQPLWQPWSENRSRPTKQQRWQIQPESGTKIPIIIEPSLAPLKHLKHSPPHSPLQTLETKSITNE